jgi:hypothetical protein
LSKIEIATRERRSAARCGAAKKSNANDGGAHAPSL